MPGLRAGVGAHWCKEMPAASRRFSASPRIFRRRCGGRRPQTAGHRPRAISRALDADRAEPYAPFRPRRAAFTDRLRRCARGHPPCIAANQRSACADLRRSENAGRRDDYIRPGSAGTCENRRALLLGEHPIACRGARMIRPRREWNRVRRPARRAVATAADGSAAIAPFSSSGGS